MAPDEPLLERIDEIAVAFLGSFVAIELISRFLGARSAAVARGGTIAGGFMYIVVGLFPVFLGLAAAALAKTDPGLKAEIGDSEQVVAILSQHFLPKWHYVVFGGALVSAILSVVHSALHASGAQVSHNIVVRVIPSLGARGKLITARISVLALTLAAFLLALTSERIKGLVEIASAFGSAGVFVTAVFGMFTRFGALGPRRPRSARAPSCGPLDISSSNGPRPIYWPLPARRPCISRWRLSSVDGAPSRTCKQPAIRPRRQARAVTARSRCR